MIRDLAVDILMGRLGNRTSTTLQQAVIDEMVFVQENLLEGRAELPWFLLTNTVSVSTVTDTVSLALPTGFLMEWEEGEIYLQNSDGSETALIKEDWDILKTETTLDGTGKPTHYDIAGDNYLFRKTPDAVYELQQRYYKEALSLAGIYGDAANIENAWLKEASDWLIAETGVVVASQRLQSDKMANMFMKQSDLAMKRIMTKHIARIESNKVRQMDA